MICLAQLCELETISIFFVLAVQRFISWKKPVMFQNQSKFKVAGSFGLLLVISHAIILSSLPFLTKAANEQMFDFC